MAEVKDRIAPIGLPAGQFELSELEKAVGKATSVENREQHPERIVKAIVDTIKNPELLARADAPSIPTGAKLTQQVAHEGAEKRDALAFTGVDAEDGSAAAEMRYPLRTEQPDEETETLGEQAAERLADETDTAGSKTGAKSK